MPVEITKNYLRIRMKQPSLFLKGSFRTQDVGKAGGTKRIAAKLKKTRQFTTQGWIFELKALKTRPSTLKTLRMIIPQLSLEDINKINKILQGL